MHIMSIRERLNTIEARYVELESTLADPAVVKNQSLFQALAKEIAGITGIVKQYREFRKNADEIDGIESLLAAEKTDPDMRALYQEELEHCLKRQAFMQTKLEDMLLEGDDEDKDKNIIVEIRAGTGGEEAALFVSDLFRMYSRYAAGKNLSVEVMNTNPTGIGGLKEIIFGVSGTEAYRYFRFESGTHRVQRVPVTEAGGRIHTSAVTVAVLPEAEDVEITLDPKDIRVDVFRSSGPGGQSVNTTDSAVRVTHIPTGLVVSCQDEKSQHKNKAKAMRVLKARLLDKMRQDQAHEIAADRKKQVGTGDRSGRIRAYNFPDKRVTDHRINFTIHALDQILEGEMDALFEALEKDYKEKRLAGKQ